MRNSGLSLIQHMPVSFLDIFYIVFVLGEFYFWLFIFSFYSQRFPLQAIHMCSELWRKQFVSSFSNTSMPIYTRKHTCICKDKKSLLCMSRQHHARRDVITMHLKAACQGRIEIRHGGQCGRCEVTLLFKAEALIFLFFYCFFLFATDVHLKWSSILRTFVIAVFLYSHLHSWYITKPNWSSNRWDLQE